jgi:hypothetical protein
MYIIWQASPCSATRFDGICIDDAVVRTICYFIIQYITSSSSYGHHHYLYLINSHNLPLLCTQQRLYHIFTLCRWMEYAIAKLPSRKSRVTILIDRVGTVDDDLRRHLVSSSCSFNAYISDRLLVLSHTTNCCTVLYRRLLSVMSIFEASIINCQSLLWIPRLWIH